MRRKQSTSLTDKSWLAEALVASCDIAYKWDVITDRIIWSGQTNDIRETLDGGGLPKTGEDFEKRIHPEDIPARRAALSAHYATGERFDCEYRLIDAGGNYRTVNDRGQVEFSKDGHPTVLRGIIRLDVEHKTDEAKSLPTTTHDTLTGYYNKLKLRDTLQFYVNRCQKHAESGAYIVVDIDRFSLIDKAYGFDVGDAILVGAGRKIEEVIGEKGIIGRVGEDKFGIILPGQNKETMTSIANKILNIFRDNVIETAFGSFDITVSIGGTIFPTQARTAVDAIEQAEGCLRKAKMSGRDSYESYEPVLLTAAVDKDYLVVGEKIKAALRDQKFVFSYQPIINANSGKTEFYECLLRMREDDGNLVLPAEFIPAAERLGLITMVDRYVLKMAFENLERCSVSLAINISAYTVFDKSWLRLLRYYYNNKPELVKRLIVEITETAAIHDIEYMVGFVNEVRGMGIRVAIDDFGVGYTSFRHLSALKVDIIKIDGSYIKDISLHAENRLFVRNLASFSSSMGIQTVAECVEKREDIAFLKKEGVQLLQGFVLGRPSEMQPWAQ